MRKEKLVKILEEVTKDIIELSDEDFQKELDIHKDTWLVHLFLERLYVNKKTTDNT